MSNYDHRKIEKKWQKRWEEGGIYSPDLTKTKQKDKFYNLWMFPYPSGEGLHAGHAFASTGSDSYGRFMRMKGKTVFQPIGYDSFGIHSENFAIKTGEHPTVMLDRTTKNYESQLRSLGHGYDWTRTVTTSDADYYRWTQWLFVQMFKSGLAYRKEAPVNWCLSCKTVLADEQVVTQKDVGKTHHDVYGKEVEDKEKRVCERCGTEVEIRNLAQWFFRITEYADRLLTNLDKIDWSERVVTAQRNWIGKKMGINITYPIKDTRKTITCWTSRPDTNFGASFVVVAPEFAQSYLSDLISDDHKSEFDKYIKKSLAKSAEERQSEGRKKTGVDTGLVAINQLNGCEMPIYVADFVLANVGTGAVVGVPGHDKRDFEFAKEFDLPIKRVVIASDGDELEITEIDQVQEDEGTMVNSEFLNGLDIHQATQMMMVHLENEGWGVRTSNYHLRDWLISRQRYWGPPIPMIYCESCADKKQSWFTINKSKTIREDQSDWQHAGWWPEENLPVTLPHLDDYKPKGTGRGPLADHPEFYEVKCPHCGNDAKRETDVSDTFLDSAWYFLAYPIQGTNSWKESPSASSGQDLIDNKINESWLPVDLYFGGAEHSVLHLMYARFMTMVLHDLGYLEFEEPFPKFYAHGLMIKDGAKMSKSKGNVVNPDEYIEKFGADTLRLYLMFMGPMDGYPDFRDTGIEGMKKFMDRVWGLFEQSTVNRQQTTDLDIKMHQTIKKVTEDIENYRYNTAIASIMEYVNTLRAQVTSNKPQVTNKPKDAKYHIPYTRYLEVLALLLAPFAPHMAEEAWEKLEIRDKRQVKSKTDSIHKAKWPEYDPSLIIEDIVTIAIQVNGKLRTTLQVSKEDAENNDNMIELAKTDPKVSKWIEGKQVNKEVFIPGKLVNLVTG